MQDLHVLSIYVRNSLFVVLILTLVAACGGTDALDKNTEVEPASVKLYLGSPQIEYAGVYAALKEGYFDDEKLNVKVVFRRPEDNAALPTSIVDEVMKGGAVFDQGSAENLLQRKEEGRDIMGVLTLYQRDSRSIVTLDTSGINTPEDLVGRRLLVLPGTELITTIFFKAVGVDPESVTLVTAENQGMDWMAMQVLTQAVDALVLSLEGAVQMESVGMASNRIAFHDYGVQSYVNVIYTSRQFVEENPAVVQRFVNAMLRGLQYAVSNPEAVAQWFVENYGDQLHPLQVDVQDEVALAIVPLFQTATTKPGMMSADTWRYLADQLVSLGLLDATVKPEDVYTLRFVEKYYE